MKLARRVFVCVFTLTLAAVPIMAQSTITGVIPDRSTGTGIADVLENNWNVTEFDCLRRPAKSAAAVFSTQLPAGSSIISLPRVVTSPTLTSAPELYAALGGASTVLTVGKYNRSMDNLYSWNGASCSSQEPGCESTCFCIDTSEGEGFDVNLKSATTFSIAGNDGALNIQLAALGSGSPPSATGNNRLSLPFSTPLLTASDLVAAINADSASGSAVVAVSRLLIGDTLQTYPGTDFSLQAGLGYGAQVTEDVNFVPPFNDSDQGPTLYVTAAIGPCAGRELALTFTVDGGQTTEDIPFEFQVDCSTSDTLTAAMGINGGTLQDITSGTVDLGPFSTTGSESMITRQVLIPALGDWGVSVFVVVLLAAGIFLILGRLN